MGSLVKFLSCSATSLGHTVRTVLGGDASSFSSDRWAAGSLRGRLAGPVAGSVAAAILVTVVGAGPASAVASESGKPAVSPSADLPSDQGTTTPADQSADASTENPVDESTAAVNQTVEPAVDLTSLPTSEPTAEPSTEPTNEPTAEPTKDQEPPAPVTTKVNGFPRSKTFVAGKTAKLSVAVSPGGVRKVTLQRKVSGKWVSVSSKSTSTSGKATISLPGSVINKTKKSYWRLKVSALSGSTPAKSLTTEALWVTTKPAYQTPGSYQKVVLTIPAASGAGYKLTKGMNGVKVSKVQRKLGMGSRWETMDNATISKVKAFQRKKGLKVTGVVDKKTWLALGLSASSWTSLDTYRAKVRVDYSATKKERIEIMIKEIYKYRGSKSHYVWGGAGSPAQGADCSGLVLQGLYAAGLNPKSITTVKHSLPLYRTSKELMRVGNMKKVAYSQKKRGDLVFFGYRGGPISHVGVYLGNGKFFDLREDGAEVRKLGLLYARTLHTKMTVVRPFP